MRVLPSSPTVSLRLCFPPTSASRLRHSSPRPPRHAAGSRCRSPASPPDEKPPSAAGQRRPTKVPGRHTLMHRLGGHTTLLYVLACTSLVAQVAHAEDLHRALHNRWVEVEFLQLVIGPAVVIPDAVAATAGPCCVRRVQCLNRTAAAVRIGNEHHARDLTVTAAIPHDVAIADHENRAMPTEVAAHGQRSSYNEHTISAATAGYTEIAIHVVHGRRSGGTHVDTARVGSVLVRAGRVLDHFR